MLVLIYTNDGSLIIYFKFPNNFFSHTFNPWFGVGGKRLTYERDGDARRLAQGCKFRILISLRVFWAKRRYM